MPRGWWNAIDLEFLYQRFPAVSGRHHHGPAHDVLRYIDECSKLGAVYEERWV